LRSSARRAVHPIELRETVGTSPFNWEKEKKKSTPNKRNGGGEKGRYQRAGAAPAESKYVRRLQGGEEGVLAGVVQKGLGSLRLENMEWFGKKANRWVDRPQAGLTRVGKGRPYGKE